MATNALAINRIDQSIDEMAKLMEKVKGSKNPAPYLLKSPARINAFKTQALARLYKSEEKNIKKVYQDYKKLEDGIGEVAKWNDLLSFAIERNANEEKIADLKKKLSISENKLNEFLLKDGWTSGSIFSAQKENTKFLDELDDVKERQLSLKLILKSLKKVNNTEFDMKVLEEGNGLHEFRRELRWQMYQIVNLGGLIDYKQNRLFCPLDSYERRGLNRINKYTEITKIFEEKSCYIDFCLMNEISVVVSEVGTIKDEVEGILNTTGVNDDQTPEPYLTKASAIYDHWKQNNALDLLINQIENCL